MYSKAYRWVAEPRRFPNSSARTIPENEMMMAAAKLYERIAGDFDGEKQETGAMDKFLKS